MNVLLLSKYGRLGASTRLRSLQYLPILESRGIRVTACELFDDAYLSALYSGRGRSPWHMVRAYWRRLKILLKSRRFDLVWIEKEIFPWCPAWAEAWLGWAGVPYVVDYDDAIFHKYDCSRNALVRRLLGRKIDKVMKGAAVVVAGNRYLADRAKRAGAATIEIIPTSVDLSKYPVTDGADSGVFRVGWIGTPVTAVYLSMIKTALARVGRASAVEMIVVGAGNQDFGAVPAQSVRWEEGTEASAIAGFGVGVMPLPDEPWEKGKCGYKLIQYMACGRPVIASPVGANADIVKPGVNGFLASTEEEWVKALEVLSQSPSARLEMGRAGRRQVENGFSTEVSGPRLAEVLQSAARRNGNRREKA